MIQDDFSFIQGTPLTWKDSGGTFAMTLQNLATTVGRRGPKSATLLQVPPGLSTAILPELLKINFETTFAAGPTAGGAVDLYLGWSNSATAATNNPAGLDGADGAAPNADTYPQLTYVGSLIASNNLGTAKQGPVTFWASCLDIAFSPVIHNGTSQNLTNSANVAILTVTPYYRVRST